MPREDEIPAAQGLVDGFGVFKFDLNIGQTCEFVQPAELMCDDDSKNIAMLCFPDSVSIASKSSSFDCLYYLIVDIDPKGRRKNVRGSQSLSCYVYFRQVEDNTSSRGYYQKSFVLFSKYPVICETLLSVARSVGNKFFLAEPEGCGIDVLVDALNDLRNLSIASFKSSSGLLSVHDSSRPSNRQRALVSIGPASFNVSDLVYSLLDGLWHVWECIMVGLPILVYASGPDISCHIVLELSRLVSPFPVETNLYPYLSIFDPKFKIFSNRVPKGCIVGVTSPIAFERLHASFSVVICIDTLFEDLPLYNKLTQSSFGSLWIQESITSVSSGTRDRMTSLLRNWSLISDTYRLVIPSDIQTVRSKLVSSNINDDAEFSKSVNRGIIANYFSAMTRDFLHPFRSDSPAFPITPVGHFATISVAPEKMSKLYSQFMKTNRFHEWLITRRECDN